jgi:hypothetical protein
MKEGTMPVDFSNAWKTAVKIINDVVSALPNILLALLIMILFLFAASFANSLTRRFVLRRRRHQGMALRRAQSHRCGYSLL